MPCPFVLFLSYFGALNDSTFYFTFKLLQVAFHALRFSAPIVELGNKLAERMQSKGPYIALHLRLEKDVWVRTGCLPGLSREYDDIINNERKLRPELLTARSNMTYHDRKLAGLCPLNALEVTRYVLEFYSCNFFFLNIQILLYNYLNFFLFSLL